MAFKTFAPGVLTSSDVNTFLMRQAVITCTSSTRPSSPSEGMTIYETDTDLYATYTGSAWLYVGGYEDFSLTLSSGWSVGNGSSRGTYARIGDVIIGQVSIIFGSTSTFGASEIEIDLPVARDGDFHEYIGVGQVQDVSTTQGFHVFVRELSNRFRLTVINTTTTYAAGGGVTSTIPTTLNGSDGDRIGFSFFYKAA